MPSVSPLDLDEATRVDFDAMLLARALEKLAAYQNRHRPLAGWSDESILSAARQCFLALAADIDDDKTMDELDDLTSEMHCRGLSPETVYDAHQAYREASDARWQEIAADPRRLARWIAFRDRSLAAYRARRSAGN